MKKITILICSFILAFQLQAQTNEDEARILFEKAVVKYDEANYLEARTLATEASEKLGKKTPKVLYLIMKSNYALITEPRNSGKVRIEKNYTNCSILLDNCNFLLSLINKDNYPKEKYDEIISNKMFCEQFMKKNELQKTKSAKDAIDFLNNTFEKFSYNYNLKNLGITEKDAEYSAKVKFELKEDLLMIKVNSAYKSERGKKFNKVGFKVIFIKLSTVSLKKINTLFIPTKNVITKWESDGSLKLQIEDNFDINFSSSFFGKTVDTLFNTFAIISNSQRKNNEDGDIISLRESKYSPNLEIIKNDLEELYKSNKAIRLFGGTEEQRKYFEFEQSCYYIHNFLNEDNAEYINGNYKNRIIESFGFLIDIHR